MKHLPFISLILFGVILILINISTLLHFCDWEDCTHNYEYKSFNNFKSAYNAEEYSDLYLIELTHFLNPTWTYEKCEDYVFSQN